MIDPKRLTEADKGREVITPTGLTATIKEWSALSGTILIKRPTHQRWIWKESLFFAHGTYQDGGAE